MNEIRDIRIYISVHTDDIAFVGSFIHKNQQRCDQINSSSSANLHDNQDDWGLFFISLSQRLFFLFVVKHCSENNFIFCEFFLDTQKKKRNKKGEVPSRTHTRQHTKKKGINFYIFFVIFTTPQPRHYKPRWVGFFFVVPLSSSYKIYNATIWSDTYEIILRKKYISVIIKIVIKISCSVGSWFFFSSVLHVFLPNGIPIEICSRWSFQRIKIFCKQVLLYRLASFSDNLIWSQDFSVRIVWMDFSFVLERLISLISILNLYMERI